MLKRRDFFRDDRRYSTIATEQKLKNLGGNMAAKKSKTAPAEGMSRPDPQPDPQPDPRVFVFTYGGLRITIERGPAGEIRSISDSQGNTWTREASK